MRRDGRSGDAGPPPNAFAADLVEAGYLSPFRVFAPSHPDLSGVRVQRGDYVEADLSQVMNESVLVADIVATWKAKAENRSTLCFAVDRAHAKHLEQQFAEAGVAAGYIDAYTPASERARVRDKFADGSIRLVCNVGCLTTGVDWDVRCIILARPTKSEILFVQIIGRGLRTAEGKEDCLILDHSDNHLRLGFVTDIHHAALDGGRERQTKPRSAPLPKECPRCSYLKPARVASCPSCGFRAQLQAAGVLCEDGQLVELTSPKGRSKIGSAEKAGLFGMLKSYARRHRYQEGWAAHKFREATGVWPSAYKHAPELDPSPQVLSWIRSRQIAWAKSHGGDDALRA